MSQPRAGGWRASGCWPLARLADKQPGWLAGVGGDADGAVVVVVVDAGDVVGVAVVVAAAAGVGADVDGADCWSTRRSKHARLA